LTQSYRVRYNLWVTRIVGFDVDGTVANSPEIGSPTGLKAGKEVVDIEGHMRYLMATPGTWVNPRPKFGAIDAMKKLTKAGIRVIFISACGADIGPLRLWWLQKHFGKALNDDVRLYCSYNKAPLAVGLGVEAFLDDSPHNIGEMVKHGIKGFVAPSDYEQYQKYSWIPGMKRASLLEFVEEVIGA
jgi:hypothetical protein